MKRNPLILFFIAVIVAAMLFAGIRAARNNRANGPAKGQLIGNLAPDFELPSLDGKNHGPQGFQIIGVAMDDASLEDIAKFAKEMGVNYPILLGKESVGQSYGGVSVLPTTFFLDRDGKLIAREFGLQSRSVFVDHIKKAMSQGQAVQAQK